SLAVRPAMPGVVVQPGHVACQRRIDVEESFDSITILPAAYYHPVPRLSVVVRDHTTGRTLASGFLGDGHPENRITPIRIRPAVAKGGSIDLCIRDAGRWKGGLLTSGPNDNQPSYAMLDGHVQAADILIEVQRPPRRGLAGVGAGPALSVAGGRPRAAAAEPVGVGVGRHRAGQVRGVEGRVGGAVVGPVLVAGHHHGAERVVGRVLAPVVGSGV